MIPDPAASKLAAVEARLRAREEEIRSGALSEAQLQKLAGEGEQLLRQLQEIRAAIAPMLCQAEALLRQLEAARGRESRNLDCRF